MSSCVQLFLELGMLHMTRSACNFYLFIYFSFIMENVSAIY